MRKTPSLRALLVAAASTLAACSDGRTVVTEPAASGGTTLRPPAQSYQKTGFERDGVQIVRATGDIVAAVNAYRNLLGALNPNVAGEQPGGRREVNWDGVPALLTNSDNFPGNFFNVNSPRGVLFGTNGSAFRISDVGYVDLNSAYVGEFNVFSPKKLFVARGGTITDVTFVVAGSTTPATVTGFGSVFADVGRAHSTTIEYFDASGNRLLSLAAPRRSDAAGLSFVGAVFASRIVARVRITSGDTPIGDSVDNVQGAGKKLDIVAMDDFIYGEPRAQPIN